MLHSEISHTVCVAKIVCPLKLLNGMFPAFSNNVTNCPQPVFRICSHSSDISFSPHEISAPASVTIVTLSALF